MTDMPDHVRVYSWATGREVAYTCTWPRFPSHSEHKCNMVWAVAGARFPSEHRVPDPDSDAFLADVLKGLGAKGWLITMWVWANDAGVWQVDLGQGKVADLHSGTGPTPNAALVAAVNKIGEQG